MSTHGYAALLGFCLLVLALLCVSAQPTTTRPAIDPLFPIEDEFAPMLASQAPIRYVQDATAAVPAPPGASIQIEPPPRRRLVTPGAAGIEPAPLDVRISGPEVARVGDMPIFTCEVLHGAAKLIQWTVDPAVTRMGEDTTQLGIATPTEGQYRIRVLVVDDQWRRAEAQWVCTIDPHGAEAANAASVKDLSTEWTVSVGSEATDSFGVLQAILRDVATLIRLEELTSDEQMEATLDELMETRLSADQQIGLQPWFDRLNAHLEREKRLGRLRTLRDIEAILDRAADGLPVGGDTH